LTSGAASKQRKRQVLIGDTSAIGFGNSPVAHCGTHALHVPRSPMRFFDGHIGR